MPWWVKKINKLTLDYTKVRELIKRIRQECKGIRKRGKPTEKEKRFLRKARRIWITKISHACVWDYYLERYELFSFKACKDFVYEMLEDYDDLEFYYVDEWPDKYVNEVQEVIRVHSDNNEMSSGHMFISIF